MTKDPAVSTWAEAERELSRRDRALAKVIRRVGPCRLTPGKDYFAALCRAIVAQQISGAAARTVIGNFRGLFPRRRETPAAVLKLDDATLRSVGLSRQKLTYIRSLAEAFDSGAVPVRRFPRMSDEEIIASLVPIKGIGRWTAEMFLIFVLNRPDVFPVDDLGVQEGARRLLGLKERPKPKELMPYGERWRPWRTVATWYLWRRGTPIPKAAATRPAARVKS